MKIFLKSVGCNRGLRVAAHGQRGDPLLLAAWGPAWRAVLKGALVSVVATCMRTKPDEPTQPLQPDGPVHDPRDGEVHPLQPDDGRVVIT